MGFRTSFIVAGWCLLTLIGLLSPSPLPAACTEESVTGRAERMFVRHVTGCSGEEQAARAVTADELLTALRSGKGIDLAGVVVTGDLRLDELTPIPVDAISGLSTDERNAVLGLNVREVRLVPGPLSIRDSVVKGTISTGIKEGYVLMRGPVILTGTVFEHLLDLSRCAFLGPVDLSKAVILREGFFVDGRFTDQARFVQTAFGVHSRFFRSVFAEPVTYAQAKFNGLAEFLEVTFQKDVDFSQVTFTMGTGFSGSTFLKKANFSDAVFEREAFFLFSMFREDALFRHVTFRSVADFSDSQFKGEEDFTDARFETQPQFTRVQLAGGRSVPSQARSSIVHLALTAILLLITFALVMYLIRVR